MFISPFTPKWAAGEGTGEEEGHPPAVTLIYASPARFANQTLDRIDKAGLWLLLMRRLPPLAAVRAFEAAARAENFTAAAAELGMTQAAVSYQVKSLEDRLGAPLFVRDKGRVRLTPLGARLLPALSGAFDAIEAAFASHRQDE